MIALIVTVLAVFLVLLASEAWWRRSGIHGEFSRKFVHITVGSFVAFWPYFLTPTQIKVLSAAFLVGVIVSKNHGIFQAIHSVQRPTLGEAWFAIVVGVLAFTIPEHPHIYTAALLVMSLADGLAAVVGTRYGNSGKYTVFGYTKSVIGTSTFFVVTCLILFAYAAMTDGALPLAALVPLTLIATALENFAVNGYDNLFVPLVVAGGLLALA